MSTRVELAWRGDPLLKNELLTGAKSAVFTKGNPLKAMRGFLFSLKTEAEAWENQGIVVAKLAKRRGCTAIETPCTARWTHLRATAHRVDTAAIAVPTWSLLDGVVKSGLLVDDDKRFVVSQLFDVEVVGFEGIRLVLETVPGAEQEVPL